MKESTLPFMNIQASSSKSNPPDIDFEDTSTRRQASRLVVVWFDNIKDERSLLNISIFNMEYFI